MILNIDKHERDSLAVIDSAGDMLKYGELTEFVNELKELVRNRSLVFVFAGNDVGGIAWSVGLIGAGIIPLLLSPKIDKDLLQKLEDIYQPGYI